MYIAGCEPTVNALFSKVNYPVSRGTPSLAPFCDWFHEDINPQKSFFKPLPVRFIFNRYILRNFQIM